MFGLIALIIVSLITYKLFALGSWANLVKQYRAAATAMGLDSEEALIRLKLYCDTFDRPPLNGKQAFKDMMQAKGKRLDPHRHTVQVMWHLTDDIVYLGDSHCSRAGLEVLLPEAELKTALAAKCRQKHPLAHVNNRGPASDAEYVASMPMG